MHAQHLADPGRHARHHQPGRYLVVLVTGLRHPGVIDRFGQIEPKVLITCAGYRYAGKIIDQRPKVNEILERLPSLQQLIVLPYAQPDARVEDFKTSAAVALWNDFYRSGGEPAFVSVPFDHPLYILYSSGTTGVPKCIVHGTGGVLLQHVKEHGLHVDLGPEDRLFYYTTCGWMMWNWLVSALAVGSTVVLYDGSPFHPGPERLLDLIDQQRISVFGTSPKFLATLESEGLKPRQTHRLDSLKTLLSTGSALAPHSYDYVYRDVKSDVCLASMSGGTDIVSCFVNGNPLSPVRRGEMQGKSLGMAVQVWNEAGTPVIGEKGELVCTRHFPAMPIGLWNDPRQEKLRASYFSQFPGVWAQGDYAEELPHGGFLIHGRSDAVLNPGGVRIGTAEIYRQVEKVEQVLDCVAIGQQWQGDVRVVLFVRLRDGVTLDEALVQRIRQVIRANTTPRHVPAKILAVSDIPRTISGKVVELAVRNVVHGEVVKNTDALANPGLWSSFGIGRSWLPELNRPQTCGEQKHLWEQNLWEQSLLAIQATRFFRPTASSFIASKLCSHRLITGFASTGSSQALLPQVLFPQKYSIHKPPLTRRRVGRWRRRTRLGMQLQPQSQVVRRVSVFQGFLLIDGAFNHQVEQCVIKGLHSQFL